MNILVTAGNTQAPIDKVRCVTNIFTGRTGASIALHAYQRGHDVTLLTSHPEVASNMSAASTAQGRRWNVVTYRTFDELRSLMQAKIAGQGLEAVIHCAAVSDYLAAGIYAAAPGTHFDPEGGRWTGDPPALVDRQAGKVKSDEPELWLRLVRAPKLVDFIRAEWGFRGLLVKFKLEVGIDDDELLRIAERSRAQSAADLMVANILEGAGAYAYLGPREGAYQRVPRSDLAARLIEMLERIHEGRSDG